MIDRKILIRYILGKASISERRAVAAWVKESPENMEHFAELKAQYVFNSFPNTILPEKRRVLPVIVRIAAMLSIPLLAAAIWMFISRAETEKKYAEASRQAELVLMQNPGAATYVANRGTKSSVVLPDSSIVRLNGGSRLVVPHCFNPEVRELFLDGEGYFEVQHHEDWPMKIHTPKNVTVEVLGTTFDLSAYEDDARVKVTLIEGCVVVHEDRSNIVHEIAPKQEILISGSSADRSEEKLEARIKEADVQKNTAWMNNELVFDNTPMAEIVKQLERWYGVTIHVLDEDVMNYHLTATFTSEPITKVMDIIRFSSMLDYKVNGDEIYLKRSRS